MKHYIVKALSVGGLGNRVYKSRDKVRDVHFPEGNAEELVKLGFLIPDLEADKAYEERRKKASPSSDSKITEDEELELAAAVEKLKSMEEPGNKESEDSGQTVEELLKNSQNKDGEEPSETPAEGAEKKIRGFEEINKREIVEELDAMVAAGKKVVYDPRENKTVLYAIWAENQ